jgi:hypothetical protein
MNLISCKCGVVLDKGKLTFPDDKYLPDGSINLDKCVWNGNRYVTFAKCPVCGNTIPDKE